MVLAKDYIEFARLKLKKLVKLLTAGIVRLLQPAYNFNAAPFTGTIAKMASQFTGRQDDHMSLLQAGL